MTRRATAFAASHQGVLALLVVLVAGWFIAGAVNATAITILVLALYYAIGGLSFNFLYGSLGIFSLAQPVFVAVGGYTAVYLYNTYGISPWLSLLIAPVIAAIIALPIALVATRIGGGAVLTALVTLIVAEAATPLLIAIKPIGGAIGLYDKSPAQPTFSAMQYANGADFVRILLAINVVFIGLWMWWNKSRFGLFVTAIKDAPEAGESVGVPNARMRLTVFLIAAMLAAPAGVVYAQYNLLTSPDLFLSATALFQFIVVALVGGAARPWGALVGSLLITYLSQEVSNLSGSNPGAAPLTFAVVFVIMALIVPRGLSGTWERIAQRRRPPVNASLGPITKRPGTVPDIPPPPSATGGEDLTSHGITTS
jgi:branched-chain amino acid transport system permease protein